MIALLNEKSAEAWGYLEKGGVRKPRWEEKMGGTNSALLGTIVDR